MQVQVSPNAWQTIHSYQGPTRNPIGDSLEAELSKQQGKTADQCRADLRAMGMIDEPEPDAARAAVWDQFAKREKAVMLRAAGLSTVQDFQAWNDFPEHQKRRLWRAIQRAGDWGDRIREVCQ